MKKPTLTIAIPAYNEGEHITALLRSLLSQDTNTFALKEIIVASDGSSDDTVACVRSVKSSKVKLIDSKRRKGKAYRQNQIFRMSKSDIIAIFDADIIITDKNCLEQMVAPIVNGKADMTSGAILELPARTVFEEILDISMRLKRVLFLAFKGGNNVYNCHGPARAISKEFYSKLTFPQSAGEDMYSYLAVVSMAGRFKFTPKSKVSYRLPAVPGDHYKQSLRYMGAIDKMDCFFDPKFVSQELKIPKLVYIVATFHALPLVALYPIHTFLYVVTFLGTHLGKYFKISPRELWSVSSSKQLTTNHNSFSSIRRAVYSILSTWDRLFSNINPAVIYAYHAFDESGRFSTTAQDFKSHMDFIMKTHTPVKLSEIAETIRKEKKFNTPVFAVTFDDGYASILKVSQICKKLNICPTINLISNHDEAVNVDNRTYLSTNDIKELLKLGWEVGSHTKTHQMLTEVYKADLVSEISDSKEQIEKQINHKIVTVAYPLGRYNKEVLSVTRSSGYTVGLTMDDCVITKETDPLKLPRVGVDATHTTKEFSYLANPSVVRFRSLLKNSPLKSLFINI